MKQVQIIVTREFYGRGTRKTRLLDTSGRPWQGKRKEALEMIAQLEDAPYYTAHNEVGRASYTITYNII